jgi:hypothetical protein
MKRNWIVAVVLAIVLCTIPAFAADFERGNGYTALIDNTTFSNVTTAKNTTGQVTLGNRRTAFFVKYAESGDVGNMSLVIKPQVSQDDSNYVDMIFYDVAGTTTMQVNETISVNGTYYFWIPDIAPASYTRINMVAANATATNTTSVQTYVVGSVGY